MPSYLMRRFLQVVVVAAALSFVTFALLNLMPGDPVDQLLAANPRMTAADAARLRALYVDAPLPVRYWRWVARTAHGDLGQSRTYHVPVTQLLGPRLANTLVLAGAALALAVLIAVPLGVWAALRHGRWVDYALNALAFVGISTPSFVLGLLLIFFFAVRLHWLPAGGTSSAGEVPLHGLAWLLDRLRYLALPLATLTVMESAELLRYTRAAMLDVLGQDYLRTARAKGLGPWAVVVRHGLRNALIPVVTVLGMNLAKVFSGAVVVEYLFAYQGVGRLVYDAVLANDYNLAMAAFMLTIVAVLVLNLVVDVLYAVLDPRITYR